MTLSAASLAAIGLFCGTADAATPTTTPTTAAHLRSYDKGAFSVQETITNNTGQTLTFVPAHSSVDNGSGHWGTRPLTTLKDGQSETVTGYTDDILGMGLDVTYTLPNREYAFFQTFVPLAGDNATTVGVYGQMSSGILPVMSTLDKNFSGHGSVSHGVHVTSKVSISPTTSTQAN